MFLKGGNPLSSSLPSVVRGQLYRCLLQWKSSAHDSNNQDRFIEPQWKTTLSNWKVENMSCQSKRFLLPCLAGKPYRYYLL